MENPQHFSQHLTGLLSRFTRQLALQISSVLSSDWRLRFRAFPVKLLSKETFSPKTSGCLSNGFKSLVVSVQCVYSVAL